MFKIDTIHVAQMKDLELFFRLHFGTESFTIYNEDSLTEIEFEIPDFKSNDYNFRKKQMSILGRARKIFENDSVDLREVHVVVYYLAMLDIMKVSGKIRVEALPRNTF